MSSLNFDGLRAALLSDPSPRVEEKVQKIRHSIEVNQRHLIDKILARYSAEHTIYREVLQNANDANASAVEIVFDEESVKGESGMIKSIVLKNNGRPFDNADWNRLKKIAEGNPDEQKIGFFGVGFYSLFSICEEPFVVSGSSCLAFYWKGDQLYARPGTTPAGYDKTWTLIYLKLREPMERPHLDSFAHFLSKSILFTFYLERVSVLSAPDNLLFCTSKKRASPSVLPISPSSLLSTTTTKPSNLFTIKGTEMQAVQLDLDKRYTSDPSVREKSLLSSIWSIAKNIAKDKETREVEEALMKPGVFSVFLHVINCEVKVTPGSSFSSAMERITKKRPASHIKVSLLYSTFDEVEASSGIVKKARHPVLNGVLPEVEGGKIFIGFETHQTTGCAVHIAGPFIPTVERESLDFVDKTLSQWNEELLRVCSKIIRIIYEIEMQSLQKLYSQRTLHQPPEYWSRSKHILKAFGTGQSSPSPAPSHVLIHEFFSCARTPLMLPSSVGVVPITDLRKIPPDLESFVKDIPVLDQKKLAGADRMISMITPYAEIPDASFAEIMHSLKGQKLSDPELASCLEWIITLNRGGQLGGRHFFTMVSNLLAPVGQSSSNEYAKLSAVTHYPSGPVLYETGMPIPSHCLSPKIAERIPGYDLASTFSLKELGICDWVAGISKGEYLKSASSSEKFLIFLSKNFSRISNDEKATISSILANVPVVPTVHGLKIPSESYLEAVKVFGDVALINFQERWAVSDTFLVALGVQSHIDIAVIFSKLDHLDWDHRQLIKYLVSIQTQLSSDEMELLRAAKVFPAIGKQKDRFRLDELYLDHPVVRFLNLPIIDWKGGEAPAPHSESTTFMRKLGLRVVVPWDLLLKSVQDANSQQRAFILKYFIDNYDSEYRSVYDPRKVDFEFVPLKGNTALAKPFEVFSDDGVALLNFNVLLPELKSFALYFGIKPRPSADLLASRVSTREFDRERASETFSYLSTILSDFYPKHFNSLSHVSFVPIRGQLEWGRPVDLFFSKGKFDLGDAFQVVDFGEHAKPFLTACGVQAEPNAVHTAMMICEEPTGYLQRLGAELYLDLLRWIALQYAQLSYDTVATLKKSKALLGFDYSIGADEKQSNDIIQSKHVLSTAQDLYVIDDTISQQVFNCLAVPSDSTIENFYIKLGSRSLSSCVKFSWRFMGVPTSTHEATDLQALIRMRAPLLVTEQPTASKQSSKALGKLMELEVGTVDGIVITRTFTGQSHNQPTTAFLKHEKLLLITAEYDFFDVANALAKLIYVDHSRLPDALLISTLLSSSLASLRAKGFPVDRVLGRTLATKHVPAEDSEVLKTDLPPPRLVEKGLSPPGSVEKGLLPKEGLETKPLSSSGSSEALPKKHGILGAIKHAIRERTGRNNPTPAPGPIDDGGMQSALQQSISSLRTHDRRSIDDEPRVETPVPPPASSAEASSYCTIIPGHSLRCVGAIEGVPIYLSVSLPADPSILAQPLLQRFVADLSSLATVFKAPVSTLHVFQDLESVAIAFNRDKTLFFNFAHYQRQAEARLPALQVKASWYITFCHELAHNFIGPHDERHIYYMSCFAETFLDNFIMTLQ